MQSKNGFQELAHRPQGNIPVLDALRSLAILLVVCGHFAEAFIQAGGQSGLAHFPLFNFGWTGVDLFFVLSGFLIGRQLWKELKSTGTISVRSFILRRGVRIWPLYFFTLFFFVTVLGKTGGDLSRALPDLFMVSNYWQGIISGGWSLSTEEQFYIAVPALLLLTNSFVKVPRQWILPVGLLVLAPLARVLVMVDFGAMTLVKTSTEVYTAIHTHCDGLVAGLVIAWVSVARPELLAKRGLVSNAAVPVGLMVVGIALRMLNSHLFAFTSLALIYGAMAVFLLRDRSWISSALSVWPFYLVSKLSYGMYLNHFEVLPRLVPALERALTPAVPNASVRFCIELILATCVSLAIAALTFVVIEHPMLRVRDRIIKWAKAK